MGAQEDYERFASVADDLDLDEEERDKFIASAMKRKGHRSKVAWEDAEPEDGDKKDKDDGDFFSGKRKEKQREQRTVGGDKGEKRERFGY